MSRLRSRHRRRRDLNLLDAFAIGALHRLHYLSAPREGDEPETARRAYKMADAMLAERRKREAS